MSCARGARLAKQAIIICCQGGKRRRRRGRRQRKRIRLEMDEVKLSSIKANKRVI